MPRLDVQIPAPDGRSPGTLHVPEGDGPRPGVLVFPDAGGTRETFGRMGDRLAGMGYVALIPDIYYRAGRWEPFDAATLFTDSQERARLGTLVSVLTNDRVVADAGAYADFLLTRPEVSGPAIGTTGYCLGGRMSLIAAGGLGRTIAAAASFHGGRLAVDGDPSSPHLTADRITAAVYVAGATDDDTFTAEQARSPGDMSAVPGVIAPGTVNIWDGSPPGRGGRGTERPQQGRNHRKPGNRRPRAPQPRHTGTFFYSGMSTSSTRCSAKPGFPKISCGDGRTTAHVSITAPASHPAGPGQRTGQGDRDAQTTGAPPHARRATAHVGSRTGSRPPGSGNVKASLAAPGPAAGASTAVIPPICHQTVLAASAR